jgi:hypothetical protein
MSKPLDGAVRSFQRDNDLREDGLLKPGGPTVRTLARKFGQTAPKPRRSILTHRPALPKISGEAYSENGRSVRHLMKTAEDGLFPALLSDAFEMGEKGRGEVADFFVQLRERDPERATLMRRKTAPKLSTEQETVLDDLIDDLATQRLRRGRRRYRRPG